MATENEKPIDRVRYLSLDPTLPLPELLQKLKINALAAHQNSVGRGDNLMDILEDTTNQLKSTTSRIQTMNMVLFIAGLVLLAAAVCQVIFGKEGQEVWSALLGGVGGVSTLAATFWTGPLKSISESVKDMIKLETAFLGYIRIIGEADSAFQMQYLDTLGGKPGAMDRITLDTTNQVKNAMEHTLKMIDEHLTIKDNTKNDIKSKVADFETRLKKLETTLPKQ
jgi:hypothetical protein